MCGWGVVWLGWCIVFGLCGWGVVVGGSVVVGLLWGCGWLGWDVVLDGVVFE